MSSIPLPALAVKPPEDPMASYARVQAIRSAKLQQQEQETQLEQQKMDMDSQKAMMKAYQDANGDLVKATELAAKYGAKPDAVIKLKQASIEQQKSNLELLNAKGARAIQEADMMQGAHDQVAAAPPEQRPAVYQQTLAQMQKAGLDVSKVPPQYPGDEAFNFIGIGLKGHKQQLEELAKQTEIEKNKQQGIEAGAKAGEAAANTVKIQNETQNGPTGPAAEAKYRSILSRIHNGQQPPQADMDFAAGYEASNAKSTTQSDSLGITTQSTSRPAGLATVQRGRGASQGGGTAAGGGGTSTAQQNKNSITDLVGQYRMDPALLSRTLIRHPELLSAIQQKYPDFDQTDYTTKAALIKGYTSGTQSKEINAINTAMGHLKVLDDAVAALNNGDIKALNSIGNQLGIQVGNTPAAAFKTILHRVGPELTSAYIPGAGGEAERIANAQDFNESLAPQILHNNAAVSVKLLRSKVGALENQYKNTVKRDDFEQRFITPEANAAFQKFGGGQGGGNTQQPAGGTAVSLAAARQLPQNKGKSDADIKSDIQAHGHKVVD